MTLTVNLPDKIQSIISVLNVLSAPALVGVCLFFINKTAWKWRIKSFYLFKWLVPVPNLNGRYTGKLISTFENKGIEKKCVVEIFQTASEINIRSFFADKDSNLQTSLSESFSETIVKQRNDSYCIDFIFSNEPNVLESNLNIHGGAMKLHYYEDTNTLKGEYFNKRGNQGTIEVKWESAKLLNRLI